MKKYYKMIRRDVLEEWIIIQDTETGVWSDVAWKPDDKWTQEDTDELFCKNAPESELLDMFGEGFSQIEMEEDELFILLL